MTSEKLPPHNFEAEEAIIGSLLVDATVMKRIGTLVQPQDFLRERNRWAYEAALRVAARGDPTCPISIAQELIENGRIDALGGMAFISQTIANTPTSVHAEYYARLVHDLAERRRAISTGVKMVQDAYAGTPAKPKSARPLRRGPVEV